MQRVQLITQAAGRSGSDADTLQPPASRSPQRRRAIMRQMLIVAAIAAGLVALWAALLPLAA